MPTWYVNPGAVAGGDGTTSGLTGPNAAFQSRSIAYSNLSAETGDIELLCAGGSDNSILIINGSAASSWDIKGDPGQTDGRYLGNEDWSTSHYRAEVSAAQDGTQIYDENVTLRGLQISQTGGTNKNCVRLENASSRLEGCRIRQFDSTRAVYVPPGQGTTTINIESNIIRHMGTGRGAWLRSPTVNFRNNALVDCDPLAMREGYFIDNADHNIFINNVADWDFAPQVSGDSNATTGGTIPNLSTNEEINMVAGTDFASVTDLRPVPGGKMDNNGVTEKMALRDIKGNEFTRDNRGPFDDLAGPPPVSAGFSYGYFVA